MSRLSGVSASVLGVFAIAICLVGASACAQHLPGGDEPGKPFPKSVTQEVDAMRDIAKAANTEYERLYSSVVFPNEEMKTAAAKWWKAKQREWTFAQLIFVRMLRPTTSSMDFLLMFAGSSFIDPAPSVFVETTYTPSVVRKDLVSMAKLASLKEDYDAAELRFLKAILAFEDVAGQNAQK
jgi:hypothetical protein